MFARQILAREKDSAGGCPSCNCNGATSSDGHIDYFVFGQIHCAEDFQLSPDSRALFLGEWIHAPAYAEMDERGEMRLVRL